MHAAGFEVTRVAA